MDSGTGMISNDILPKFSPSTVNVVAQCLFVKGKDCFKSISSKTAFLKSNEGQSFSICGNGIVEYDEECDSNDKCCNQPGTFNECKFIIGAVCTSNQPCCNNYCQFSDSSHLCFSGDECSLKSYCNGKSSSCNLQFIQNDNNTNNTLQECNNGRAICYKGECAKSLCYKFNQDPCDPVGDDACLVKCYDENLRKCTIVFDYNLKKPLFLPNGWRCGSSFQGRCYEGTCEEIVIIPTLFDSSTKKLAVFSIILIITAIFGVSIGAYIVYKISKKNYLKFYLTEN